jgi:hypothetical protein
MSKISIQIQKILHLLIYIYLNTFLDDFSLGINWLIPLIIAYPPFCTGTRNPDPPFFSFGPSCNYGMDLSLEVHVPVYL